MDLRISTGGSDNTISNEELETKLDESIQRAEVVIVNRISFFLYSIKEGDPFFLGDNYYHIMNVSKQLAQYYFAKGIMSSGFEKYYYGHKALALDPEFSIKEEIRMCPEYDFQGNTESGGHGISKSQVFFKILRTQLKEAEEFLKELKTEIELYDGQPLKKYDEIYGRFSEPDKNILESILENQETVEGILNSL